MREIEIRTGAIRPIECVKQGFELIKPDFWLLFAIVLLSGLIGGATLFIAFGAMSCGMFYCFLRRIDGYPVVVEDLWKGFQYFAPGFVVGLFIIVPVIILELVIYLPAVLAGALGGHMSQDELMSTILGALAFDLVFAVGMVCFHTLLTFSFPLIVDRNLGAFAAMMTSARAVLKNLGGVVGLIAVDFVLVFAGYLALCVGIYLVIPVIVAANVVAYRQIFPRIADDRYLSPPPPVQFGGATI